MTLILAIPMEIRLAVLFVLGCFLGGLINLGIYRLAWHPRPISPWSRPPMDAPPRRAWDRIPVIGWLGLRREAPLHGAGFWIRPMLLELLCGAVFALLYCWEVLRPVPPFVFLPQHLAAMFVGRPNQALMILTTIWHEQYLAHIGPFCFMLVAFWIDTDEMTIPDGVTIPGTLLGLAIVTLWPYALLPATELAGGNVVDAVWLTSPDMVPPPLQNPIAMPQFKQPWDTPAVTDRAAAAAAIAGFWGWCLALINGRWSTRHGYARAFRVFFATVRREQTNYALLALAIVGSIAIAWVWWLGGPRWVALASSLAGLAIGGGLVWIIRILASAVMRREAMGFGDVTLLAMIGAFLGWQAAIVVFFLAPFAGIAIGIGRLLMRGEKEICFGPFLCLAAAITVLAWPGIWDSASFPWLDLGNRYFALGWKLLAVLFACLFLLVVLLMPIHWAVEWMRRAGGREQGARSKEQGARSRESEVRSQKSEVRKRAK